MNTPSQLLLDSTIYKFKLTNTLMKEYWLDNGIKISAITINSSSTSKSDIPS